MKICIILLTVFVLSISLFSSNLAKFWYEVAITTDDPILKEIYFMRSLKEDNTFIETYKALGVFYYTRGQFDLAKRYLQHIPEEKITLPRDRVITITKPDVSDAEKETEDVKSAQQFQLQVLEKLDLIGHNLKRLDKSISGQSVYSDIDSADKRFIEVVKPDERIQPTQDDNFEDKFVAFANNIENLLKSQNNQINRLNNSYENISVSLSEQSQNIQNIYTMSKDNKTDIEKISTQVDSLWREIELLKSGETDSNRFDSGKVPRQDSQKQKTEESEIKLNGISTLIKPVSDVKVDDVKVDVQEIKEEPLSEEIHTEEKIQTITIFNINTVSRTELSQLKELTRLEATLITRYRDNHGYYESIDDLYNVPGLSSDKVDAISDYIYIE